MMSHASLVIKWFRGGIYLLPPLIGRSVADEQKRAAAKAVAIWTWPLDSWILIFLLLLASEVGTAHQISETGTNIRRCEEYHFTDDRISFVPL